MDRLTDMLERYGEVCTRKAAAHILGCSTGKVKYMIGDGRLSLACGGEMVDVRSIARYICQPREADFEARRQRMMTRRESSWAI